MDAFRKNRTINRGRTCQVREPSWTPGWGAVWVIGHSRWPKLGHGLVAGRRDRKRITKFGTLYASRLLHKREMVIEWSIDHSDFLHLIIQWIFIIFPLFICHLQEVKWGTKHQVPTLERSLFIIIVNINKWHENIY